MSAPRKLPTGRLRTLDVIAQEIRVEWNPMVFSARPYADAMRELESIHDSYGCDSAAGIVRYFLSNAKGWRGPVAARIKAELNGMLKLVD